MVFDVRGDRLVGETVLGGIMRRGGGIRKTTFWVILKCKERVHAFLHPQETRHWEGDVSVGSQNTAVGRCALLVKGFSRLQDVKHQG